MITYITEGKKITGYRNPTKSEINFGHGAIHHKDIPYELWVKKDGSLKKSIKCRIDGLRYSRLVD